MRYYIFTLGAIFFLICNVTYAQTNTSLDPVTVTSAISPTKVSKTGRNITVLDGKLFTQLPVHNIDDLLKYIPGIEVQARGPLGAQGDIIIRGSTFQQVLLIIDGIRLNDPLTGHFNSYIPIAVAEIERVEILKGASSAIYGTEAVGGVIHVITKSFASLKKKQQFQTQTTLGEYGLFTNSIGGIYATEKTAVAGGFDTEQTNGQQQRGTKGFVNNIRASLSYSTFLNKHLKLSIRQAYDSRDFSAQNFYTTFRSDTAIERVNSSWSHLKLAFNKNNHVLTLDVGYKKADDYYLFSKASLPNQNKASLLQALATYQRNLFKQTTLLVGANAIQKKIRSNDRGNHQVNQMALFTTLTQKIGTHININTALRADYNTAAKKLYFVPQLNASYQQNNFQLRGSIGTTIRDADFTERYNNYGKALVRSGSLGNPDLQAETSLSYELGADYFIGKPLKIAASVFERKQQDVIDYIPTAYADIPRKINIIPSGTYALAKNVSTVNTKGAEVDVTLQQNFHQHFITATLGWIVLTTNTSEAVPSFYINSHATLLTNFSVFYQYKSFSIAANGIYKKRPQRSGSAFYTAVDKDYFLMNAKAAVSFCQKKWSVFGEIDNVFNRKYVDILGTQMPSRWLMGGVQWRFQKN